MSRSALTLALSVLGSSALTCGTGGGKPDAVNDKYVADTWTPSVECRDPSASGPFQAGNIDLLIDDPTREASLDSRMHYPATSEGADQPVDMTGAPYPLVILSHGFLMYPGTYDFLAAHLASHGFVVLGTRHQDSVGIVVDKLATACDVIPREEQLLRIDEAIGMILEQNHAHGRVKDVSTLIDAAAQMNASDERLSGALDMDRVGFVGHSFGAFTGLAASGALIQTGPIDESCKDDMSITDIVDLGIMPFLTCQVFRNTDEELMQPPIDLRDDRISALVNMAGPAELLWGHTFEGLAEVDVPVMLVYTTTDEAVPYEPGPSKAWGAYRPPKHFLTFKGGNHGNFGHIDTKLFDEVSAKIPKECAYSLFVEMMVGEPAGAPELAEEDQHRFAMAATAAFLQEHLAGAIGCEPYLTEDFFLALGNAVTSFQTETSGVD